MTDQKTDLPYKEWQDEEGRMVQNGAGSAAPLYVYADADYEEGDGSCGLHETVKRANEPSIQYRRADLAPMVKALTFEEAVSIVEDTEVADMTDERDALRAELDEAKAEIERRHNAQRYTYIGKDGKSVQARVLEDERDALKAEIERLRGALEAALKAIAEDV